MEVGRLLNEISQGLIDYGTDAVKTYASYEDNMLNAQVALSTSYTNAQQLLQVMQQLDDAAMNWATHSRFSTDDISKAISEAAHAGWDYEQIMASIPTAMSVAMAGSMDLSESLEYLIDITNASGIGFDNLTTLADNWVYAANSSSTTVEEMGDAMQRMGATLQFVDGDMGQLSTMIAVLANNGTKGAAAGTLLRNTMMRLVAPTKAAAQAMDGLLLDDDALDEIYGDVDTEKLEATVNMLQEAGFSAYDANGDLKDFLTIFEDLYAVTAGMTEEERNGVLSTIFPLRTITGAKALLAAAAEDWYGLYDDIQDKSKGYTDYAGETMESGIGGKIRLMNAALDALKTNVGEVLAEDATPLIEGFTSFITSVNDMEPAAFEAVVTGFETLALSGAGLFTTGLAMKGIMAVIESGPIGGIAIAGVAFATLASGIMAYTAAVSEENYQNNFGSLGLDDGVISSIAESLTSDFDSIADSISTYNTAIETAISDYTNAASTFSTNLFAAALTGATMSPEEQQGFMDLGGQMYDAMIEGINNRFSADETALLNIAEMDATTAAYDGGIFGSMLGLLNMGYDAAISQAETLSQSLRDAMTSAFEDGKLTPEEADNILGITSEMAELMALTSGIEMDAAVEQAIFKATHLGADTIKSSAETIRSAKDADWEDQGAAFANLIAQNNRYAEMFEGELLSSGPFTYNGKTYTTYGADWAEAANDQLRGAMAARYADLGYQANSHIFDLYRLGIVGTGAQGAWEQIQRVASNYISTGILNVDEAGVISLDSDVANAKRYITEMVDVMGGIDEVIGIAQQMEISGNFDAARMYREIGAMYSLASINPYSLRYQSYIGYDPQNLKETGGMVVTPTADMSQVEESIAADDGMGITVSVAGDTTALDNAITAAANRTVRVNVVGGGMVNKAALFAEGGRATEASIFGEAGAEWAIPEQHTQRTAELLDAARRASGFTWGELLTRNGGLNGGSGSGNTLVYSPTIYANDANGVSARLAEDKARLEAWYNERLMRENLEVYA